MALATVIVLGLTVLGGCSRLSLKHGADAVLGTGAPAASDQLSLGTYNGQVDGHTIELATATDKAVAFQLADEVKPLFDSSSTSYKDFKTGDSVQFKYFANDQGQLVITSIEKATN